jgi:hypothetical protein
MAGLLKVFGSMTLRVSTTPDKAASQTNPECFHQGTAIAENVIRFILYTQRADPIAPIQLIEVGRVPATLNDATSCAV